MRHLSDEQVAAALDWPGVLAALERAFRDRHGHQQPNRVAMAAPGGGSLLTMPCADRDGFFGVKQVAVLPGNAARGLPTVRAQYTLVDPHGAPALSCDATLLTRMRTAAVSALAARELAPAAARSLLVCGTGAQAPWLAEAHAQVRDYADVRVWGRDPAKAVRTATEIERRLAAGGRRPEVRPVTDLASAIAGADVVTSATTARTPFLHGVDLPPGPRHIDLVGAYLLEMAEADPALVRACWVTVDDRDAAREEAGDLHRAARGGWRWDAVAADLCEVLAGAGPPQGVPTLFKSVGLALEDLAVARLLLA